LKVYFRFREPALVRTYELKRNDSKEKIQKYYLDNKEEKQQYRKQFLIESRDEVYEKIVCECGNEYTKQHHSRHLKSEKDIEYTTNQEK
jgi:hypothetical protein